MIRFGLSCLCAAGAILLGSHFFGQYFLGVHGLLLSAGVGVVVCTLIKK